MPYKRYDITNKYNSKGKRVNEKVGLNRFLLLFIPILIILVILLGIFITMKLDGRNRTTVTQPTDSSDSLVASDDILLRIVNAGSPLEPDYKPELKPFGGVNVSEYAFSAVDRLINDAAKQGVNITLSKGYVSFEEQNKLYEETYSYLKEEKGYTGIRAESETKKICPEAGCSESQTGLLVTFSTSEEGNFADTKAGKWLTKYSVNYGFVLRYPEGEEGSTGMTYAPDVYRYVGEEHALNMRRYDMTLEGYSYHVNMK